MACPQCQATLPSNAAFCTRCGAPVAAAATAARSGANPGGQAPPTAQAPAGPQAQPPAGWGPSGSGAPGSVPAPAGAVAPANAGAPAFRLDLRRLTTADRIIAAASLVTFIALFLPWFGISAGGFSFSESGMGAHGWLAIVLIIALVIVAYLVLRAGWDRLPMRLPAAHAPLLLVATGLQLLFVVIAFLIKPGGLGWDFGAYLCLAAAIVACVTIARPAVRSWNQSQR
jgi:hypothetical protein